jgi:hypothetical protein
MICTFHGILMDFKKDVLLLLDESEHGKIYGKLHHLYMNSYLPIHSDVIHGLTYTNLYNCIRYLQVIEYTSCLSIKPVFLLINNNTASPMSYSAAS